jgi:hypothetical protein
MRVRCPYSTNAPTGALRECGYTRTEWRLLRKTTPSSRRRGGPIYKHINGLRANKNLVVGPDEAGNLG